MHEVESRSFEETCGCPLRITRHARVRGQQRGYLDGDISLVYEHGTLTRDGVLLTRKDVERSKQKNQALRHELDRLEGTKLVLQGNTVVTLYRPTTAQRRRNMLGFGRKRRSPLHRRGAR